VNLAECTGFVDPLTYALHPDGVGRPETVSAYCFVLVATNTKVWLVCVCVVVALCHQAHFVNILLLTYSCRYHQYHLTSLTLSTFLGKLKLQFGCLLDTEQ